MKTALYNHPSTFTYLGRHASELKFLLSRAKNKAEVLDIGPGPFEPFYIATLSPNSKITVIDNNQKILDKIKSIRNGVLLPIKEAASICFNTNDDGTTRPNHDLLDERMIMKGLDEMKIAGLLPSSFMYDKTQFFSYHGNSEIVVMEQMDISKLKPWKKFDVVFDGMVLLNLRKTLNDEDFKKTVRIMLDLTRESGILGISTTPAGIWGNKEYLSILMKLMDSGMHMQELIVDNLVESGGLRGGHLATFAKGWGSPVNEQTARHIAASEPILNGLSLIYPYIDQTRLLKLLGENGLHLIYALHAGGNYYHACFVDGAFDVPSERYQFGVMAELNSPNRL